MVRIIPATASWRDSAKSVKIAFIDYRAIFPMLLCLFFPSLKLFLITLAIVLVLGVLAHFGFTVRVFGRYIRGVIAGPLKQSRPWWVRPKRC